MKKPLRKDYCKPFILDPKLVTFDSKAYSEAAAKYINYLEAKIEKLTKSKKTN